MRRRPVAAGVTAGVAAGMTAAALLVGCGGGVPGASGLAPGAAADAAEVAGSPGPAAGPLAGAGPGTAAGPVTLAFAGDVHFEGVVRPRLGDPATAFGPIAQVLRRADLAVVNLETAVTERGTAEPKTYVFRAPATAFDALRGAGVDVVSLANNHGRDYGAVGLTDTLAAAAAAAYPVVGAGRDEAAALAPYRVTVKGQRIAVLGATHVLDAPLRAAWTAGPGRPGLASAYEREELLDAVRAARGSSDTVVVFLHWGAERVACPPAPQRTLAGELAAAGADVVVGSHAHVLLGGGLLGSTYVHYGLGNFLWYSNNSPQANRTGVLTLTVEGRSVRAAQWTPAQIRSGVPLPLEGPAGDAARSEWERQRGCTGLAPLR